MSIRLVDKGWDTELRDAIRADSRKLRIVCPFIKAGTLDRLLNARPKSIQVITRFNLTDFADGVSDIEALRKLLSAGASVRGIKNLHSKLYLFGDTRTILTSANLTDAALTRNHEFGMVAEKKDVVDACRSYFDALWKKAGRDLSHDQLEKWNASVTRYRIVSGLTDNRSKLKDFGKDVGFEPSPAAGLPVQAVDVGQAFVKFLGEGNSRTPLTGPVVEEIKKSRCHCVVAYPASKRPRQVKEGAVMFMARLVEPNDIRVFGRAIGMKHVPGRDDATPAEIKSSKFKARWSRYIRVYDAKFVAGTLENGVSLNELMDALGSDSFVSTQRNAERRRGNTEPRRAYRQQAAVQLSNQATAWLEERLQAAFDTQGLVSKATLSRLNRPSVPDKYLLTQPPAKRTRIKRGR